jgi:hypothetical protein
LRELLVEEREEIASVGSAGRSGGPSTLEGGHDTTASADVIDGVAVLDVDGTAILGSFGGDVSARDRFTIDFSLAGGLNIDVTSGSSAEQVLIFGLADEAVGHGSLDDDGSFVALIEAGINLVGLAHADGLTRAQIPVASADEIEEILGGARRSASSLELGDVTAGLADVADGVAVLGLESRTVIRGEAGDLSAGHFIAIGKGGNTFSINIDVATGLNAELILVNGTANEARSRHFGIDLDKSLVARLVAGVYGVSLADDDLIAGAKSPVFRGEKTEDVLCIARRSASPVDGVDVAAFVSNIGDGVAVLDGPGAAVLRSLGRDVLALDGGSVGHRDLAGGCDL